MFFLLLYLHSFQALSPAAYTLFFLSGVLSDIFYDVLNEPNPPSDH